MELARIKSTDPRQFSIPLALVEQDTELFSDDFKALFFKIDMALLPHGYKCNDVRYQSGAFYAVVEIV